MSKFIGNGKVRFESALEEYKKSQKNPELCESYISLSCFDFQQSIEFFLKGIVELQGNRPMENHDLRAQLNKLEIPNALRKTINHIRMNADTFNSWETKSRYNDSFVATIKDIELAINICRNLERHCDKLVKVIKNI